MGVCFEYIVSAEEWVTRSDKLQLEAIFKRIVAVLAEMSINAA
jgi:hypothetical protein